MGYVLDASLSPNSRVGCYGCGQPLAYGGFFDSIGKALASIDPTKKNTLVGKIVGTATKVATAPVLLTKKVQDTVVKKLGAKSMVGTLATNFFKTVNPVQNISETAYEKGLGAALKKAPAELVARPYSTANLAVAASIKAVAPKSVKAQGIAHMLQSSAGKAQKWGEQHPYQTAAIGAAAVAGGFVLAAAAPAGGFFAAGAGAGGAGAGGGGIGAAGLIKAGTAAVGAVGAGVKALTAGQAPGGTATAPTGQPTTVIPTTPETPWIPGVDNRTLIAAGGIVLGALVLL